MNRKRILGALIATASAVPLVLVPSSVSAKEAGALGSCIWDNVVTWDAGSGDNGTSNRIPGGDDPGYADTTRTWYITTSRCADINIALKSRPQPAQTIGVRACYSSGYCDSWKYWGSGYSGWLELNDQQPSIPDGRWFYVEMYGVDPYTTGWIAA
ncbi:hypothetical protein G5C51_25620 [Streptomyces sp. A7024]|uniref:Secreted protein n=1 Tax=Streptomyces coryli TaxID=1128680 RepID=A0A6G4U5A6_9ACTN|nr:hypothetical protein [Streptomyces coryli]NGN67273.1 hypothetical protein [Streptomyces coryli]